MAALYRDAATKELRSGFREKAANISLLNRHVLQLVLGFEIGHAPAMQRVPSAPKAEWHHLPRLAHEAYRGFAVALWTTCLERRAGGWLNHDFHRWLRELLLHCAAREGLYCPAYVLMPDHMHVVWMGMRLDTDQRNAMRFFRKQLGLELARRSPSGVEYELQKQSHDSVLREKDRVRGAFAQTCFYVLDNPRRKGLVEHPRDWPHLGAVVPGYPFLRPLDEEFWPLFWKCYQKHRAPDSSSPAATLIR